ncbi:four helix bundle protein [Bacteriovoracaceae bacterium]|nr:four helix bundle protein [Bacteriovoracaceae bacterium]
MTNNFRTLDLAIKYYKECEKLKLPTHLNNQLLRCSSSIALNLSEGRGRETKKDQKRFFIIAMASLRESQTILIIAGKEKSKLHQLSDSLGAHIYKLIKYYNETPI